ncbi:MAG: hypothetical protein AAFR38_00075 [Planctomycetota bacterium]
MQKNIAAIGALVAAGGVAFGQIDEGDIGLAIENGQIVVSLIGEDGSFGEQRVFIGEIGIVESEPSDGTPGSGGSDVFQDTLPGVTSFSTNTPGFDSGPGVFDPNARVGLDVVGFGPSAFVSLGFYDPINDTFISTSVTGPTGGAGGDGGSVEESLAVEFNTNGFQTNNIGGFLPVGSSFPNNGLDVFSNGRAHRHFNFTILPVDDPFSPNPNPLADVAVYAVTLSKTTTQAGIASSEPFIILFPFGVEETDPAFDAAVAAAIRSLTPGDFNGNGVASQADVAAFVDAFFANQLSADLAAPFGVISQTDVDAYVSAFFAAQ